MTAKMKGKPHQWESRADWERVKVKVMRWCLRVKLAQNWTEFSQLLLQTGDRPIVEESRKDDFWGAKVVDRQTLRGINVLGRLLVELRTQLKQSDRESLSIVEPLDIPDFLLDSRAIGTIFGQVDEVIDTRDTLQAKTRVPLSTMQRGDAALTLRPVQGLLFDSSRSVAAKLTSRLGGDNRIKPYPEYKDSGLPWLGKVPEHWQVLRGKSMFRCVDVRSSEGKEALLTVSSESGVIPRESANVTMFKAENYTGYKLCWPGDLVINSLWAWARGLGVSRHHGIVSSAYGVYRLRPKCAADVNFVHELMRSAPFQWELQVRSKGIWISRLQLTDEAFLNAPVVVPPLHEQVVIARYLGCMDARVRRYINAKKRSIGLLEEQRQAIVRQAITRGLDPSADLKPSGVEWLGDVPAHWEVSRVKYEFDCLNRHRIPLSASERGAMSVRQYDYYGASGVIDQVDNYLFDEALLLIAEDGANLVLRNLPLAIIARGKFWVSNHAHVLRPKRGRLEYLAELMESVDYRPWISGAAQPKLTEDRLMSIPIAVPTIDEQERMIAAIQNQTSGIRAAIAQNQSEINLLREYQSRVIADVVTGKLDVREVAPSLHEELLDLEEPDEGIDGAKMLNDDESERIKEAADAPE